MTALNYFAFKSALMFTIKNDLLKVTIRSKGAELASITDQSNGLEYMWQADPRFWAKSSPILFPIVGTLKDDSYSFEGKIYKLTRHGFARDMDFVVTEQNDDQINLSLSNSPETREKFPFSFRLDISYALEGRTLRVGYTVLNTGKADMYFSIGGHPAFNVPLEPQLSYEDYYLSFENKENSDRWPISDKGLIELNSLPQFNETQQIPLKRELFYKDALVFRDIQSNKISLRTDAAEHGLELSFPDFPYLGLWAAKDANFICIEPWCGIADSVDSTQELTKKEGIIRLPAEEVFERSWSVRTF